MKKLFALFLSVAMTLSMTAPAFAQNDAVTTNDQAKDTAILFATTSMSDFVQEREYRDDLVHSDASALLQYLHDKREIKDVKEVLFGRKLALKAYDIRNTQITEHDSAYVVSFDIMFSYMDGDLDSGMEAAYKVVVDKDTNQILAAMTSDLSGGSLIAGTIGAAAKDLNLDYQLNQISPDAAHPHMDKGSQQPYDVHERIKKISSYSAEVEKELANPKNESPETAHVPKVSPYATFVSFTSSDRASMRSYQDSWWNSFNPSFANFTNYGGDCTNYASQVLNSSSAPQYSTSASGIHGYPYWYYRSSNNRSSTWTGVEQIREYLLENTTKGPSGYRVTTFGALESGDIVQLHNGTRFYHSVVVYTQGGDPWVTAHTSPYSGYYSSRYGGIDYSRIHISGYYN